MGKFILKNKILFVALAIVLVGSAGLVIALTSRMADVTAGRDIQTAVSESAGQTPWESVPEASPVSEAERMTMLVGDKEMRRSYIIPSPDCEVVNEAKTWECIEPANYTELEDKAFSKAGELAKELFNYEITDTEIDFRYYTDTSKNRADFLRVATMDDAIVCVLAADTLDLIEIDYFFVPAPAGGQGSELPTDNDHKIADKVAAFFGTGVSDIEFAGGITCCGDCTETFDLTMKNGKIAKFATMNGELYAVGVYPTEACMSECVYFEADIQHDPSAVRLASPQNFVIGEPGKGDMTKKEALSIYNKFLVLANGAGDYPEPAATFFIDKSGTRENYWHLEGAKLTVDIASKSKWLVSLECAGLRNPEHDLKEARYDSMEGKEYEEYVKNILNNIYGDTSVTVELSKNDYYYCNEGAALSDGTWYEFYFTNGKLTDVQYYFDEYCYTNGAFGWKADNTYINTVSEEEFIPQ